MNTKNMYEYINDFFYFVLRPDTGKTKGTLIYCSGINLFRFLPITGGRHGLCSNPAFRGLQLLNHGVRALALTRGASPQTFQGNDCAGITPTKESWYTERLLIENAPVSLPDEIISYCVINLLKKIFNACLLEAKPPDKLLKPDELQAYIESMCTKFGR